MKRIFLSVIALILAALMVFGMSACSKNQADESVSESDTSEDFSSLMLCATIHNSDGTAFAYGTVKIGDKTYTTDYLGYVAVEKFAVGERTDIALTSSDEKVNAEGTLKFVHGDALKFDDKTKSSEKITVPDDTSIVSVTFEITEDGKLNCTALS